MWKIENYNVIMMKTFAEMEVRMDKKKEIFIALGLLIVIIAAGAVFWYMEKSHKEIKPYQVITSSEGTHDVSVVFINAGKADSILVMADGKNYLIDTGLSDSATIIKEVLLKYRIDKLDGVFITHTHKDHVGGLKKIAKEYDIDMLYSATISMNEDDGTNKIDKAVKKSELQWTKLNAGDRIEIADKLYMEVIGPLEYNGEDDNDNSLVLRMIVNGKVFLFAGDMQFAEEQSIMNAGTDVSADILKVGNHGNPDATSEKFAKAVNPELAIITTDTTVDTDTANSRVTKLFKNVILTQDYHYGLKITIDKDGNIIQEDA